MATASTANEGEQARHVVRKATTSNRPTQLYPAASVTIASSLLLLICILISSIQTSGTSLKVTSDATGILPGQEPGGSGPKPAEVESAPAPPPQPVTGFSRTSDMGTAVAAVLLQAPSGVTNMEGLVKSRGYILEQHDVVTSDGYILTNFRIPCGKAGCASGPPGPPVLLIHGLSLASTCWVVNEPDESLAFILADKGYDVWMMNTRGNTFSLGHTEYWITDPRYWSFSMDEMALSDLPTTIDDILKKTGKTKVAIVGHSQGGTLPLMLLSRVLEYNDRVSLNIGMAPTVYLKYMASATMVPFSLAANMTRADDALPPQLYAPLSPQFQELLLNGACQSMLLTPLCVITTETFAGPSAHITSEDYKNALQWAQMYNEPQPVLREFNYGPVYNLGLVRTPTMIMSGGNDLMVPPKAIELTKSELGDAIVDSYEIPEYTHMDFVWDAARAKLDAYPRLMDTLQRFTPDQ